MSLGRTLGTMGDTDAAKTPEGAKTEKRAERQAVIMFWTLVASAITTAVSFMAAVVTLILSCW